MKRRRIHDSWLLFLVLLIVSLTGLYFIDEFTMKPSQKSGNGNLALLAIAAFIPVSIGTCIVSGIKSYKFFTARKSRTAFFIFLTLCMIVIMASVSAEIMFVRNLLEQLGGGTSMPGSRIYRFPWLNQYTNTIYFNMYNLMISIALSSLCGAVLAMYRKRSNSE